MIQLENEKLLLNINDDGSIESMVSKATGWKFVSHNENSQAFKLMLPLENFYKTNNVYKSKRDNMALSGNTKPSSVRTTENSAIFIWNKINSEFGGEHDIKITAEIVLSDTSAVFSMEIENNSNVVVENAFYPYLCPFNLPNRDGVFDFFSRGYAHPAQLQIFPRFTNFMGYYGVDTPILHYGSNPQTPYCILRNKTQGVAVMIGERNMDPMFYQMQMFPGWGESMGSYHPFEDKIAHKDVYFDFSTGQLPFIVPGETRKLIPILIEPYVGDWYDGADIWRRQRAKYFTKSKNPKWLDEPHSWLQYHVNSPEDELRIPFRDLPKLAKQCKDSGITAIQFVGWNDGGQDQGNPYHDFDPRLGTLEELKAAIKECQDMGVKIILFSKFNWADEGDPRYRSEQYKHTVKDPFGNPYQHPGYKYQTLSQFSNVRVKRLIPLCFNSKDTIDMCKHEFDKITATGCAGNLYDECFHRGAAWLCFDESHGHRVPAAAQGMDIDFAKIMMKDAPDEFLMAGEALYDSMFESYHLSYFRTESDSHIPLDRYVANDCRIMTAVTGFTDRNMINQCLLFNYIVSYEPYNFKGKPEDYPVTLEYGKKMQALREELRDYLWDGEFLARKKAKVLENGNLYNEFSYSVFQNKKDNTLAAVIANFEHKDVKTVSIDFEDGSSPVKYRLIDGEWQSYKGTVNIPPRSAVVILSDKTK